MQGRFLSGYNLAGGMLSSLAVVAPSTPRPSTVIASAGHHDQRRHLLTTSRPLLGLEQVEDIPYSSDRKPRGLHRGPDKRMSSHGEKDMFQFVKAWDLQMQEQWDELEAFKGQPKPKKQLGNEPCEVVWPYGMLIENVIRVHRFTKSIYVYYPFKQSTKDGTFRAEVAKRFSRECLIPITFHNSQCYIETEMLVEHGETPWVAIHCLDGATKVLPISMKAADFVGKGGVLQAKEELLHTVLRAAHEMGESVTDVSSTLAALNERAPQNQYVRVDYQWFGGTPEERMTHQVQWDFDGKDNVPSSTRFPQRVLRSRMNVDHGFQVAHARRASGKNTNLRPHIGGGMASFLNGQAKRQNARYSPAGGAAGQVF